MSELEETTTFGNMAKCEQCDNWFEYAMPDDQSYVEVERAPFSSGEYFVMVHYCDGTQKHPNFFYWKKDGAS